MNILGNPVGNLSPRANFNQTDSQKADYIDGRDMLMKTITDAANAAKITAFQYADSLHFVEQILVPSVIWPSSAPYTVTISGVDNILDSDTPHYSVVYSSDADKRLLEKEAFALIDDLEAGNGSVTITCFEEKPEVTLTIQLEVNR